jgi:hypothetical protein
VNARDAPVQLKKGVSKRIKAPPGSATAGSEWVQFSVLATNTSDKPILFTGYSMQTPFCGLETRAKESSAWVDYGLGYCGTGAAHQRLAPGAATAFSVSIPASYEGQDVRVTLPFYYSPPDKKSGEVLSEPARIK